MNVCQNNLSIFLALDGQPSDIVTILLCDCLIIIQAVIDVFKIMILFVSQVALSLFNAITFGFGQLFLTTFHWTMWIVFRFMCGILGLEDKPTSAFSWLFLVVLLFFYCDRNHHDWFIKFSRLVLSYHDRFLRLRRNNRVTNEHILYNEVVLENQRNEHREIEPINRQLELENRENENEENNLVEADRHRIDNDNRRNIARENGADSQRASIENRQNVERERQNTRTSLENRRNRTQEQHRYFLRQRNRNQHLHQNRPAAQHGVGAAIASGQNVLNGLLPNGTVAIHPVDISLNPLRPRALNEADGYGHGIVLGNGLANSRTRQGIPHRDGGSMSRQL